MFNMKLLNIDRPGQLHIAPMLNMKLLSIDRPGQLQIEYSLPPVSPQLHTPGGHPVGEMLLLFCAAWMALASEAFPDFSIAGRPRDDADRPAHRRPCTVDELLPNSTITANSRSSEWSEQNTARDPYGCDCSFTRGRYVPYVRRAAPDSPNHRERK